jgi:hypothetical protein
MGAHEMSENPILNSEFNDFLFTPICEETNGMPLSILSALARLDMDPWQEAARLTRLPQELAARSLSLMIGELSGRRWSPSESEVIAARLVQLLPSRTTPNTRRMWQLAASVINSMTFFRMTPAKRKAHPKDVEYHGDNT